MDDILHGYEDIFSDIARLVRMSKFAFLAKLWPKNFEILYHFSQWYVRLESNLGTCWSYKDDIVHCS